jgi:hypothetical protein
MVKVHKSRIDVPLLLISMLVSARIAQPADIPPQKPSAASSAGGVGLPRAPRLLSRLEIFQAIQGDLAGRGIRANVTLQPDDLLIQSSVPVVGVKLGLVVKKIGYDPVRRETIFELWASGEPSYLPFEVSTRRDPQSLGLIQILGSTPLSARSSLGRPDGPASLSPSKEPALVKPGNTATLVILGENVRITIAVAPLQLGFQGQSILVRDLATARVFTAVVAGAGLLQARL